MKRTLPALLATVFACTADEVTPPDDPDPMRCGLARLDPSPAPAPPSSFGEGFVRVPWTPPAGVALPPTGLMSGDFHGLTGAVAGDLDDDGDPEVLMGAVWSAPRTVPVAFTYRRATRTLVPYALADVRPAAMPMALLDLDGDGRRDVLDNTPSVSWNLGAGRFDVGAPLVAPRDATHPLQVMGAAVWDVDRDGWLDLVVGLRECCATCRAYALLLRTGPRTFTDRSELIDDNPRGGAYTVLATPLGPSPMVLATFSNCGTPEAMFHTQRGLDDGGLPHFAGFDPTRPSAAYRQPRPAECPNLGCRAPMGAAVTWLDDDDFLDLAVSINARHEVFRGSCAWPLPDLPAQSGYTEVRAVETARAQIPWGVAFVDVDRDGRPDAVHVHGDDFIPDEDRARFIGVQHPTVHWNAGSLRFVDVTARTGLDRERGHGRSLWTGDLDGDGDVDLLVGGHRDAPRVLRNEVTGGRGLALALHGTVSNPAGLGATVRVWVTEGSAPQRHFVGAVASPHAVSEPLVFVGLGPHDRAARVEITWPSGHVQTVTALDAGRVHTVTEPAFLTVDPPSRHAPADARSTVTVTVRPLGPDGTPAPDTPVTLAITHGTGTLEAPMRRDGDRWIATLRAPATPGSARLEVRLDGRPLTVWPRVWWD